MPRKNLKNQSVTDKTSTDISRPDEKPKRKKSVSKKTGVPAKSGKAATKKQPVAPVVAQPVKTSAPENSIRVNIDHPSDGETIGRAHYAIRISCSGYPAGGVEISIDDAPEYMAARESVGFWWFDWCDIPEGVHTIVARAKEEDGSVIGKSRIVKITAR